MQLTHLRKPMQLNGFENPPVDTHMLIVLPSQLREILPQKIASTKKVSAELKNMLKPVETTLKFDVSEVRYAMCMPNPDPNESGLPDAVAIRWDASADSALQADFLHQIKEILAAKNIHFCVDHNNAVLEPQPLEDLVPLTVAPMGPPNTQAVADGLNGKPLHSGPVNADMLKEALQDAGAEVADVDATVSALNDTLARCGIIPSPKLMQIAFETVFKKHLHSAGTVALDLQAERERVMTAADTLTKVVSCTASPFRTPTEPTAPSRYY